MFWVFFLLNMTRWLILCFAHTNVPDWTIILKGCQVVCALGHSCLTHPNHWHSITSISDCNWWMVLPFAQSLRISLESRAHRLHWSDSVLKVRRAHPSSITAYSMVRSVKFCKNVWTFRQFKNRTLKYLLTMFCIEFILALHETT